MHSGPEWQNASAEVSNTSGVPAVAEAKQASDGKEGDPIVGPNSADSAKGVEDTKQSSSGEHSGVTSVEADVSPRPRIDGEAQPPGAEEAPSTSSSPQRVPNVDLPHPDDTQVSSDHPSSPIDELSVVEESDGASQPTRGGTLESRTVGDTTNYSDSTSILSNTETGFGTITSEWGEEGASSSHVEKRRITPMDSVDELSLGSTMLLNDQFTTTLGPVDFGEESDIVQQRSINMSSFHFPDDPHDEDGEVVDPPPPNMSGAARVIPSPGDRGDGNLSLIPVPEFSGMCRPHPLTGSGKGETAIERKGEGSDVGTKDVALAAVGAISEMFSRACVDADARVAALETRDRLKVTESELEKSSLRLKEQELESLRTIRDAEARAVLAQVEAEKRVREVEARMSRTFQEVEQFTMLEEQKYRRALRRKYAMDRQFRRKSKAYHREIAKLRDVEISSDSGDESSATFDWQDIPNLNTELFPSRVRGYPVQPPSHHLPYALLQSDVFDRKGWDNASHTRIRAPPELLTPKPQPATQRDDLSDGEIDLSGPQNHRPVLASPQVTKVCLDAK